MERFEDMARRRVPIIGGGAGTGLSAKCEETGGIDLIVIYNSGRYRMAGRGSLAGLLAYGNANDIVVEMAREVLPVVRRTPVLAGVNGTDPFMLRDRFLRDLAGHGLLRHPELPDRRPLRRHAPGEPGGDGHGLRARGRAGPGGPRQDLLTTPYVFSMEEAVAMARAGADIIVAHMGLTTGGTIGAETALRLEDCPALHRRLGRGRPRRRPGDPRPLPWRPDRNARGRRLRPGPHPHCHGFYGASSMERLPTEEALTAQVRAFKAIGFEERNASMERHHE
jgi:predicted TIM-barrel enzyme